MNKNLFRNNIKLAFLLSLSLVIGTHVVRAAEVHCPTKITESDPVKGSKFWDIKAKTTGQYEVPLIGRIRTNGPAPDEELPEFTGAIVNPQNEISCLYRGFDIVLKGTLPENAKCKVVGALHPGSFGTHIDCESNR